MTILTEHSGVRFHAAAESTAPAPPEVRGSSRDDVRLLVARPDRIEHHRFGDLPDQLEPGDLVVVNDSATVNAEIDAVRDGLPIVLHAAGRLDDGSWVVELRTSPDASEPILDAAPGETIGVGELPVTLVAPYPREDSSPTGSGNRLWRARVEGDLRALLDRHGRPIAYGYLDRPLPALGVPVRLQPTPRQRGDGLRRTAVHRCPGDAPGHARGRRGPGDPAHRRLLPGGRRRAAARVVPRAGHDGAAGRAHPRPRRPGRRDRHHRHARARVSGRRRDGCGSRGAGPTAWSRPPTPRWW